MQDRVGGKAIQMSYENIICKVSFRHAVRTGFDNVLTNISPNTLIEDKGHNAVHKWINYK